MPIIPNIGRRSFKLRIVIALIYLVLSVGSVTMIYPFFIMLSGSVKGDADVDKMDPVPEIATSEQMRFARFEEDRYYQLALISAAYGRELYKDRQATLPRTNPKELRTFHEFLKAEARKFPDHFYVVQESAGAQRVLRRNFRLFRDQLRKECGTTEELNRRYSMTLSNWNEFPGALDGPFVKEFNYERTPFTNRWLKFKRSRPMNERVYLNVDGYFWNLQKTFPMIVSGRVKPFKVLTETCPSGPRAEVWVEFVKHRINCLFVRLTPEGMAIFRKYLASKYPGGPARMNHINGTSYPSFEAVNASVDELRNPALFSAYTDFVTNVCPVRCLRVDTIATRYRHYTGRADAMPPFVAHDYSVFKATRPAYLREIVTRNYRNVIDYMVIYGRAVFNTVIYIGLSILAALTVNPIAAYALSRFNLKSTYTVLMFFLATMAFPGAVTMIPNFLLLKHFHLLNSFWALLLPVAANGYTIFILKGFFDSIPKEMYESAMIDGASEWTMFWRFTMALSKPILALVTLGAFTSAYTAFMFALIICPDERMWTLMVWLYQLQQGAQQSVVYAALVLAALPTLLVFVFAQNTIMKGIVVPVEK